MERIIHSMRIMLYGAVKLSDDTKNHLFLVNGQRVKHCYGVNMDYDEVSIDLANNNVLSSVAMVNQVLHERQPMVRYFKLFYFNS